MCSVYNYKQLVCELKFDIYQKAVASWQVGAKGKLPHVKNVASQKIFSQKYKT